MLSDFKWLKNFFFERLFDLGAGSRRFKSSRPDHKHKLNQVVQMSCLFCFWGFGLGFCKVG